MNPKLKEKLEKLAKRDCAYDTEDFNAQDWYGGNFDDAFSGGCDTGETLLAREILSNPEYD